jgi:hypothetical protein
MFNYMLKIALKIDFQKKIEAVIIDLFGFIQNGPGKMPIPGLDKRAMYRRLMGKFHIKARKS